MNSDKLKKLQSIKNEINSQITELLAKKRAICKKIDQASRKNLIISEHAIIRYLERVKQLDLEQIKNEILTEENKTLMKNLGDGKYPIKNTKHRAVLKDGVIVTVS